ncbi:uncharacterized protein LOC115622433 [Scaptodrosophila lebanonensis]|uniref:inositol-phosphate phosphatase n=1 Tax=Drosophila lebanonensis TaxID=7225 RepID=A0A6J2T8B6_DROLE|nr:uncharacterized protein LOC115622433 [Scaptodrosophila lebanonensis]
MEDDKKKKDEERKDLYSETPSMENPARSYGLEDEKANQQDPRVAEIRRSEKSISHASPKLSKMKVHESKSQEKLTKPKPSRPPDIDKTKSEESKASDSFPESRNSLLSNPARDYGLEEGRATRQDPRVAAIRHSDPKILKRATESSVNVARNFGLEDKEANQEDPRVNAMRPSLMKEPTPKAHQKIVKSDIQRRDSKKSDHGATQNRLQVTSANSVGPSSSKNTNTDASYDATKMYNDKTTNTSRDSNGMLCVYECPIQEKKVEDEKKMALDLDECFEVAINVIKRAGEVALTANKGRLEYTTKQHEHDLVTRTDTEVEAMIIEAIHKKYPDHKFIGEEHITSTDNAIVVLSDEPTWVIDPIDGTMNYVHHFPYYCISVALLVEKKTEIGIILSPAMGQCYTARRGMGAHLNGEPITTSGQTNLKQAMILQEYCPGMNEARTLAVIENARRLITKAHALRSVGSSAMDLAMVASGVADAFYFFGLHIWDIAAGILLVTEAGGVVMDPAGGPIDLMSRRVLAASTKKLALELISQIQQDYPSPRDDQDRSANADECCQQSRKQTNKKDFHSQTEFSDSSGVSDNDQKTKTNQPTPSHH